MCLQRKNVYPTSIQHLSQFPTSIPTSIPTFILALNIDLKIYPNIYLNIYPGFQHLSQYLSQHLSQHLSWPSTSISTSIPTSVSTSMLALHIYHNVYFKLCLGFRHRSQRLWQHPLHLPQHLPTIYLHLKGLSENLFISISSQGLPVGSQVGLAGQTSWGN